MKKLILLTIGILILVACGEIGSSGGGGGNSPNGQPNNPSQGNQVISDWQNSTVGQEGHGGDAIVCFNIPVERALYKLNTRPENGCRSGETDEKCSDGQVPTQPGNSSGVVWRMTEEGRRSIRSAKPLEQYLGERVASKKIVIDQLNRMSLEEGYQSILQPITNLPAAFNRISQTHRQLGWLHEDGVASEYGLMDINDSGFVNETEIDTNYCKELQAVVRRDHQLWYDRDIVSHFDNAGRVLIQLHEEIYTWGKALDQLNMDAHSEWAHQTSTKTRRLILKLLDDNIDHKLMNQNLKDLGFSILFRDNTFNVPTSVGFYMDSDACVKEQKFLRKFFNGTAFERDQFWLKVESLVSTRYLKTSMTHPVAELRHNYPDALSNMIALTLGGASSDTFYQEIMQLLEVFEKPESCVGGW